MQAHLFHDAYERIVVVDDDPAARERAKALMLRGRMFRGMAVPPVISRGLLMTRGGVKVTATGVQQVAPSPVAATSIGLQ